MPIVSLTNACCTYGHEEAVTARVGPASTAGLDMVTGAVTARLVATNDDGDAAPRDVHPTSSAQHAAAPRTDRTTRCTSIMVTLSGRCGAASGQMRPVPDARMAG